MVVLSVIWLFLSVQCLFLSVQCLFLFVQWLLFVCLMVILILPIAPSHLFSFFILMYDCWSRQLLFVKYIYLYIQFHHIGNCCSLWYEWHNCLVIL